MIGSKHESDSNWVEPVSKLNVVPVYVKEYPVYWYVGERNKFELTLYEKEKLDGLKNRDLSTYNSVKIKVLVDNLGNPDYVNFIDNIMKEYINQVSFKCTYEIVRRVSRPTYVFADWMHETNNSFGLFVYAYVNLLDKIRPLYLTQSTRILEQFGEYAKRDYNFKLATKCFVSWNNEYSKKAKNAGCELYFVQHGITWAKSARYFNDISNEIKYIVCSNVGEYNALKNDSDYKFNKNRLILIKGMPAYDLDFPFNGIKKDRNMTIMFTHRGEWRVGINQTVNDNFKRHIDGLLNSKRFAQLVKKYGLNVNFVYHHAVKDEMKVEFNVPKYVNVKSETNLDKYLQNSDVLITDYSSICFKHAYMKKMNFHYQFDYDVMSKDKFKSKGWYNWKTDSLGYRAETLNELLDQLEHFYEYEELPSNIDDKINMFFGIVDGNNSMDLFNKLG